MADLQLSFLKANNDISHHQNRLLTLPRSNPLRSVCHSTLAATRLVRYMLSDECEDLDRSISHSTQAILLSFDPPIERDSCVVTSLYYLAHALLLRSQKFKRLSDLKHCVDYLLYLRDQSLETPLVPRNDIAKLVVQALTYQGELESQSVDPTANIEGTAALSRFRKAIKGVPMSSLQPLMNEVIECLRALRIRFPGLEAVSLVLVRSLYVRFLQTYSHDDCNEAMSIVDKLIAGPNRDLELMEEAMMMAAKLAESRFQFYEKPEYLEEAIFRSRILLSAMSFENPDRHIITEALAGLEKTRFDEFGVTSNRQDAEADNAEVANHSYLTASSQTVKSDESLSDMPDEIALFAHIKAMGSMDITDLAELERAIEYCRFSLTSSHSEDPSTLYMLCHHLFRAFYLTGNAEYLDESIVGYRELLKKPDAHQQFVITRHDIVESFSLSLLFRLLLFGDVNDLDEVMQLFHISANNSNANILERLRDSCEWARLARHSCHPSTPVAYESAISLMQDSLTFAPTLEIQHFRLVAVRDQSEKLSPDYASYQIHIGQLSRAIETLERGRGLLWSEMRSLRTSIDQLRVVNLPLADKFAAVNQDLEALTMSGSHVWMNDLQVTVDRSDGMDTFGRLVVKQQKLIEERAQLISQIQSLPGFETFLSPPSFDTIRSAASRGPVIIINHSEWRSDVIILLHDSPPSLIQTTDDFYDRGKCLKDKLLAARNKGLDSREYEDALRHVLKELYGLVGRSVIERLQGLNVPEQSRVWWCPTSVFCSLPLHAMGPVRSDGRMKLYFSDLYIPSYTPTLSALIESRKPNAQTLDKPSMLVVVQPDVQMPKSLREMQVVQTVCPSVETLSGKLATPNATLEGLKHHRFAHISCHGILEIGKPFDAFFKLYEGARLTLLDIVRSRLPTADFAFLSACHTAEITEDSIADEGLHLAAAVQYSGFRSVVGTMWAMADTDGPVIAESFYKSVFSEKWQGVPYYERTAEALRDAVRNLRRKRKMALERWVNYVHYGA